ncbi:YheC/YheD family protein [Clostridium formicaceticum]|nr:YheC/YheD family protein [Clostridium formicaceticum]AOY77503.1 hypothetical protein BJL90_17565 [Clostridium formicaceticum]
MKEKVLIGLLCNNLKPVSFYKIDKDSPINLLKFTVKGISWTNQKIRGIILKNGEWQQITTGFPDVVYHRCYTSSTEITSRLETVIGKGKVFNSFTRFNKYQIYSILKETKLKDLLIPTYLYNQKLMLAMLKEEGAIIIKPQNSSLGSNIYKFSLENKEYKMYMRSPYPMKIFKTTETFIDYVKKYLHLDNYIMQPFIFFKTINGRIFDIRMLVQKNHEGLWDITEDMSRISYKKHFITNITYAIRPVGKVLEDIVVKKDITHELRKVSIQVAKTLEKELCVLGEISVDLGIGLDNKLWIIEVNGKPEKTIFQEISEEAVERAFLTPLSYAAYLAKT